MLDLRTEVRTRVAPAGLSPSRETEIVQEIVDHLEERRADLLAAGTSEADVDGALRAELDGHDLLIQTLKLERRPLAAAEVEGGPRGRFFADLLGDLRYGLRALIQNRGFTVVTLVSLALGIGANTAIFQLVDAIHMRTLPVEKPGELAVVQVQKNHWGSGHFMGWHADLTYPLWEQIRDAQQAFDSVFVWGDHTFNLSPSGEAHWARGLLVSGDFWKTLGIRPVLGTTFTAADDRRASCAPGAVVSHGFWQRELGGSPDVIGRSLSLDGHDVPVIGVAPPTFFGPEIGRFFDVAVPICFEDTLEPEARRLDSRIAWWLSAVGRLKPGWTIERAAAHFAALSTIVLPATIPPTYPVESVKKYLEYRLSALPAGSGLSQLRDRYSTPLYFLFGIAGLVLLIACANLANLFLARGSIREREMAVRLALGASRSRLIRQLMTESLLLAVIGSALGLLLARFLGDFLVAFLNEPNATPLFVDLAPDLRIVGFSAGMALLTCILFGLTPAIRASRTDVGLILKATGRATSGTAGFALRRFLVVVQVALSFVLLVGALLFVRSLRNLANVETGFRVDDVLIAGFDLRPLHLPKERRTAFATELVEHLRATGGIDAAASIAVVPLSGSDWSDQTWLEGPGNADHFDTHMNAVSPGAFAAMETPLKAGRDFGAGDVLGAPQVAIVNETYATKLGVGPNPVGQRFRVQASPGGKGEQVYEIVGLVGDTKYKSLRSEPEAIAYLPAAQDDDPDEHVNVLVRSRLPLGDVVGSVKRGAAEVSPSLSIDLETFEDLIAASVLRDRLMATLAGFFGLLAGLLATVGLYGVIAYSVARRTQEIGIRMALGADGRRVSRMIVSEAARLVGIGLVVGVGLALVATRAADAMLYGLASHDPVTFVLALVTMTLVALVASLVPAWRAAKVEPMVALRDE